jgi:hypothetical protein
MASAQISETTRPAYLWSGSEWIPIGDGGGGGLSLESASLVFLSQSNASVIYATKNELNSIDLTSTINTASAAAYASASGYVNSQINALTTSDIEEGTNLYFTNNRAINAGSATYLSQSNASSTYLPKSGGSINGSLIIDGNLTVSGSTTYLNVNELNIEDNLIVLNYGVSGSPSLSAGIEIERGTSPNVSIQWNESNDRWEFTKDGSNFKELGSGAVLYQSASPNAVALGLEVGSVWIDSDGVSEDAVGVNHIHGQYISTSTASSLYLTKTNASATYATIASLSNINLTSTINTASAAAYASASAYTNQQVASINLTPYQTIANASVVYLSQASASSTYATQAQLSTIDADNLPDIFLMMGG